MLVHGLGASRETWAAVLAALALRYDVLALDLPGHGQARALTDRAAAQPAALAGTVGQVCAQLGLDRPHLVGNSLGAWITLEMAADGHAASVTALAPAGLRHETGPVHPMLRVNRVVARAAAPLSAAALTLRPIRALAFATGSVTPSRLDLGLARSAARAMAVSTGYTPMLRAAAGATFCRAGEITVPVSVVFGDRDAILPGRVNQQRDLLPAHTRWETWERCGHAPMWDHPERTIELIEQTVAATEGPLDR